MTGCIKHCEASAAPALPEGGRRSGGRGRWHTSCAHRAPAQHSPVESPDRSGTGSHPECCSPLLCSLRLQCAPTCACNRSPTYERSVAPIRTCNDRNMSFNGGKRLKKIVFFDFFDFCGSTELILFLRSIQFAKMDLGIMVMCKHACADACTPVTCCGCHVRWYARCD